MEPPVIRVLPLDELGGSVPDVSGTSVHDPLAWAQRRRFTPSGRAALDLVLEDLALRPEDDVLITNSSGQTWISACVTCIVFNYCRPSRVLTDRTRAIVVIHEYGYPHPGLAELLGVARERGIPLIEDCAQSLDSRLDGRPLGSFGDAAIFSLPKVLPVAAGGVLVGGPEGPDDEAAAEAYRGQLPALAGYSCRRRENYAAVRERFAELPLLLEAGAETTPFYIGLLTDDAPAVKLRSDAIEWGSTLRDDLLLVTTNPFVEPETLIAALEGALA